MLDKRVKRFKGDIPESTIRKETLTVLQLAITFTSTHDMRRASLPAIQAFAVGGQHKFGSAGGGGRDFAGFSTMISHSDMVWFMHDGAWDRRCI